MNTSKEIISDKVYTGVIAFRPGCLTPSVRMQKEDGDYIIVSLMVEYYDQARSMDGQQVKFTILKNPYGPHIVSDYGFAKLV